MLMEIETTDDYVAEPQETVLCSKCQMIDFKAAFETPIEGLNDDGFVISGHIKEFDHTCAMCTLILSLNPPSSHSQRSYPNVSFARDGCNLVAWRDGIEVNTSFFRIRNQANEPITRKTTLRATAIVAVPFAPDIDKVDFFRRYWCQPGVSGGMMLRVRNGEELKDDGLVEGADKKVWGNRINPKNADFLLIRSWIDKCEGSTLDTHRQCAFAGNAMPLTIYVIDCFTKEIVSLPKGVNYAALSYVWGEKQETVPFSEPKWSNKLPHPAPATIEAHLGFSEI